MKTATVRELRHQFNRVLDWIEHGEVVTITKRTHPIAILTPTGAKSALQRWPDFKSRMKKTIKPRIRRNPGCVDIVDELRQERV